MKVSTLQTIVNIISFPFRLIWSAIVAVQPLIYGLALLALSYVGVMKVSSIDFNTQAAIYGLWFGTLTIVSFVFGLILTVTFGINVSERGLRKNKVIFYQ